MKFIKLTEAAPGEEDAIVYIDPSYVVSFGECGTDRYKTILWLSYPQKYMEVIVRQSLAEVLELLDSN